MLSSFCHCLCGKHHQEQGLSCCSCVTISCYVVFGLLWSSLAWWWHYFVSVCSGLLPGPPWPDGDIILCLCVLAFIPQVTGWEHQGCAEGWGTNFVYLFNTLAQNRTWTLGSAEGAEPGALFQAPGAIPAIPVTVPEPVSWHCQPHGTACALIWPWNLLFHSHCRHGQCTKLPPSSQFPAEQLRGHTPAGSRGTWQCLPGSLGCLCEGQDLGCHCGEGDPQLLPALCFRGKVKL